MGCWFTKVDKYILHEGIEDKQGIEKKKLVSSLPVLRKTEYSFFS